jgi:hypothetical protein
MQIDRAYSWAQTERIAHELRISNDKAQALHYEMVRHGYFDTTLVPQRLMEQWLKGPKYDVPESFYTRYKLD